MQRLLSEEHPCSTSRKTARDLHVSEAKLLCLQQSYSESSVLAQFLRGEEWNVHRIHSFVFSATLPIVRFVPHVPLISPIPKPGKASTNKKFPQRSQRQELPSKPVMFCGKIIRSLTFNYRNVICIGPSLGNTVKSPSSSNVISPSL